MIQLVEDIVYATYQNFRYEGYVIIIAYHSFRNVVYYDKNNLTIDFITLSQLLRIISLRNYLTSFPLRS